MSDAAGLPARPLSPDQILARLNALAAILLTSVGGLAVTKNLVGKQGLGLGVSSTATAAGTTVLTAASSALQVFTGSTTQTVTLAAANAFGAGIAQVLVVKNLSSGNVTINRAGSDTIDAAGTTLTLTTGQVAVLMSDGVSKWVRIV